LCGIRTHDPGFQASEDSTWLRPLGYRDRPETRYCDMILPNFLKIRHLNRMLGLQGLGCGGRNGQTRNMTYHKPIFH
jgi:hypothetical protein